MDFDQQWAVALQKARVRQKIPLSKQRDNLLEQIGWQKNKLRAALPGRDKNAITDIYKQLVKLRAKLFLLQVQLFKEKHYTIDEEAFIEHLTAYLKECKLLAKTLNNFLATKP